MTIQAKISLLEELATTWNEMGFSYGVANGLQGYPETIGRDLDVVFESEKVEKAVEVTVKFLERKGFLVLPYKLGWPHWIVGIRRDGEDVDSVQVDIFDHLQWAFCWVVDGIDPAREKVMTGPFQVDPWACVGKRVFLNGLSGNFSTFEEKPWYLETTDEEANSMERNLRRISGEDDRDLRAAIENRDSSGIRSGFERLRPKAMKASLRVGKLFRRFHSAWLKQYCFNIHPPYHTPVTTLVGGAETETFGRKLAALLEQKLPFAVSLKRSPHAARSTLALIKKQHRVRRASALIELVILIEPEDSGGGHRPVFRRMIEGCLRSPDLKIDVTRQTPESAFEKIIDELEGRSRKADRDRP